MNYIQVALNFDTLTAAFFSIVLAHFRWPILGALPIQETTDRTQDAHLGCLEPASLSLSDKSICGTFTLKNGIRLRGRCIVPVDSVKSVAPTVEGQQEWALQP